jgi:hemoglobin
MRAATSRVTALVIVLTLGAPLFAAEEAAPPPDSLYARLGGKPVVTKLVSDTIDQVVADRRINQSFTDVNIKHVKDMLVEQICQLGNGGCVYSGDPMREVHAGHHISESEFYGLVEVLRRNMVSLHVGLRERNELLALLAPMKSDVVDVPAPPARPRPALPVAQE